MEGIFIFGYEEKDILRELSSLITDSQVQSWIDNKYHSGYFNDAKSALQIFLDCDAHFDEPVRPLFIANDIENYTKKKNFTGGLKGSR